LIVPGLYYHRRHHNHQILAKFMFVFSGNVTVLGDAVFQSGLFSLEHHTTWDQVGLAPTELVQLEIVDDSRCELVEFALRLAVA
jgi:hypothetical protein